MAEQVVPDDCVECEDGEIRPLADCVECDDGEFRLRTDCVECDDGDWRPMADCEEDMDGNWHPADEVITLASGDVVHQDRDGIVMRHDGEYDWLDDCSEVDGEWYPSDDVFSCGNCGTNCHNEDGYSTPGHRDTYCRSCYDDHCTMCDECGDTIWRDDACYDEESDACCCSECHNATPRLILGYGDKSANKLQPESRDRLLFGIELEVESPLGDTAGAEYVRGFLPKDYCVFKHDGSLGEGGFEIVTRPDSVAVHKRHWDTLFNDSPGKRLRSWIGGRCGMHVHVTKSALSQLQLGKMLCFLNDPANERFVSVVAGRKPCSWCKVSPKKPTDIGKQLERYVALNITPRTAEFRIFRGTVKGTTFYKNLEFVQALCEFCSPAARSIAEASSFRVFCQWLRKRDYPNLHAYLVAKGFIQEGKRRAA